MKTLEEMISDLIEENYRLKVELYQLKKDYELKEELEKLKKEAKDV